MHAAVNGGHKHPPTPAKIHEELLKNNLTRTVKNQPASDPSTLVSGALANHSVEELPFLPPADLLTKHSKQVRYSDKLKRERTQLQDAAAGLDPGALLDSQIALDTFKVNGQEFLLHDTGPDAGDDRIIIFGTDVTVTALQKATAWFSDGTFWTAPAGWRQIYTVFGETEDHVLPLLYVFLRGKSAPLYDEMWRLICGFVFGS